jgi:hypothetical protein
MTRSRTNLTDPIQSQDFTHARKCTATNKKTGLRCKQWAILGGTVCRYHGGNAPQVKRKAEERLKELVAPAITALQEILEDPKHPHRMAAVKEILERDGRIGQAVAKAADDGLITYEQLEMIVRRREQQQLEAAQ